MVSGKLLWSLRSPLWTPDAMFDDEYDEVVDEDVGEASDEDETLPCPHCGANVYEDAPQCPQCGNYITFSTNPWNGRPWWWIVFGMVGIAAAICALLAL